MSCLPLKRANMAYVSFSSDIIISKTINYNFIFEKTY